MKELMEGSELPSWFNYPKEFLRIVEQGLLDLDPWVILQANATRAKILGLAKRYPSRQLVPFAAREDNDDVACWEKNKPDVIVVIHDYASPGWENRMEFLSFWDWLRSALEETIAKEP